jgi:hypothetical protein
LKDRLLPPSPVAANGLTTFFGQAAQQTFFGQAAFISNKQHFLPPVPEIQQTLERLKDGFYLQ